MRYEKLVKDFADRTKKNLSAIERQHKYDATVFETTQLVNSCLGLIVLPRERDIQRIPTKTLDELQKEGGPTPCIINPSDKFCDLKDLIEYLRNAIAHFNIEFTHDDYEEISGLKLWNQSNRNSPKEREAKLSVDNLRGFVEKFSEEIVQNLTE